jgi:hypothetical protein
MVSRNIKNARQLQYVEVPKAKGVDPELFIPDSD